MNLKKFAVLPLFTAFSLTLSGCWNQDAGQRVEKPSDKKQAQAATKINKQQIEKEKELETQQKIRDYLQKNSLTGAIAIVSGKKILFNEGAGYADESSKSLNQSSTTYPIGSITKTFVATSIMQLQEQGKLNIQDPVSKYIPGFPDGNNIKLYQFLTHTSGIERPRWHQGDTTPLSLVQLIEKNPLKYQPGTRWDYLDANYWVLGYIIEKITGKKLDDYIQANILDKIPLKNTGFITPEHPVPYTSIGYLRDGDMAGPTKYLNTYPLFACGNIYTTAYDLTQYDQALMNGRLISMESLKQVLTPSGLSSYGLGLYNKENRIFSVGIIGGWYTMHAYYPEDKISIAVLLNERRQTINIENVMTDIYQIVKSNDQQIAIK